MCSGLPFLAAALLSATVVVAEEVPVRDPMRPFNAELAKSGAVARPRFALTAVLVSSVRRIAVINGERYQIGALVDGAELVAIEPHGVHLRAQGIDHDISLGRTESGRPRATQGGNAR